MSAITIVVMALIAVRHFTRFAKHICTPARIMVSRFRGATTVELVQ